MRTFVGEETFFSAEKCQHSSRVGALICRTPEAEPAGAPAGLPIAPERAIV